MLSLRHIRGLLFHGEGYFRFFSKILLTLAHADKLNPRVCLLPLCLHSQARASDCLLPGSFDQTIPLTFARLTICLHPHYTSFNTPCYTSSSHNATSSPCRSSSESLDLVTICLLFAAPLIAQPLSVASCPNLRSSATLRPMRFPTILRIPPPSTTWSLFRTGTSASTPAPALIFSALLSRTAMIQSQSFILSRGSMERSSRHTGPPGLICVLARCPWIMIRHRSPRGFTRSRTSSPNGIPMPPVESSLSYAKNGPV